MLTISTTNIICDVKKIKNTIRNVHKILDFFKCSDTESTQCSTYFES